MTTWPGRTTMPTRPRTSPTRSTRAGSTGPLSTARRCRPPRRRRLRADRFVELDQGRLDGGHDRPRVVDHLAVADDAEVDTVEVAQARDVEPDAVGDHRHRVVVLEPRSAA